MPTPTSSSRRSSKSGGQGGSGVNVDASYQSNERREKAKSSQIYDARRRGSKQVEVEERPRLKSRTNSAPLVDARLGGRDDGEQTNKGARKGQASAPQIGEAISEDAQDSDEEAGVVGAVKDLKPFRSPELSEPIPEINVAVLGGESVGKSTLVQRALDLPGLPPSQATQRNIKAEGQDYLLRLLEVSKDDVDVDDDDDTVMWPETIDSKIMPKIDGALVLYSIKDRSSLEDTPEMLNAFSKAGIPLILIATKCDALFEERQIDPTQIETQAKRSLKNLLTVQTSAGVPETHKRSLSMILRSIITARKSKVIVPKRPRFQVAFSRKLGFADFASRGLADDRQRSPSATRRRAHSNAIRPVSPQPPKGHARASSEYVTTQHKERHSRHDSSLNAYGTGDHLKVPREESQEEMHGSFLFEETPSEASTTESMHESSETTPDATPGTQSAAAVSDSGTTFDELVDRLLSQPTSKTDTKFCAIFLALYRKFAAPGRLLESIVERFDSLDRNGTPQMMVTVNQLRYLTTLEQWLARYPGDFAFPKTKKRMRTFVGKLSQSPVFGAAGKEMASHLDTVQKDDDTNWAYTDQDRANSVSDQRSSISSRASTLIDDPAFNFDDFNLSGSTIFEDLAAPNTSTTDTTKSISGASTTSSQIMLSLETAQRQAEKLQPHPRVSLTKIQWRTLMEIPEEMIAKELTRMDWVMFSSIRPRDLVRQVSLSKSAQAGCKNLDHVNRMTDHFNHIAFWVANYILLRDKPKHRAFMLEKLMRVARRLRELNNYNALGAFIAGVKGTAIHRLTATRELLPPDVGKDWMKLEILMAPSKSHGAYRLAWENSSAERIPYLPLLRRDLVGAEEANKTFVGDERNGRINWKKFEIQGEVLVNMQKAQGMPYRNLAGPRPQDTVRELVLEVKIAADEDELFERSKMLEPSGAGGVSTTSTKLRDFFKR